MQLHFKGLLNLSFMVMFFVFSGVWASYLYKVVEDSQRNDDDREERSGQADDKQCPQHTQ